MKRENCIVQVVVEIIDVSTLRPYVQAGTKLLAGSGVILNLEQGIIVTNAHVAGGSENINCYSSITGRRPLKCDLISIMREKDLALLKLKPDDLKILQKSAGKENLNVRLVDHLTLKQGCNVYAAGYPLGTKNVQVTTGCFSGLSTNDSYMKLSQSEDTTLREPTFIVTSAALNHGMSGGGLFEENGGLIGIITAGIQGANQIGFAIPSRMILANLDLMQTDIIPVPPTLNFRWSNLSSRTARHLSCEDSGIMIRHALPDSIFHGHLDRGDILTSLIFDLPEMQSSSVRLEGNIETHGDISVKRVDGQEDSRFSSRRFSLPEIVDYLVPGSDVEIKFSRKGEKKSVKIKFKNHDQIYRVRSSYHSLRPLQWIQIDGVVMQDTTLNTLAECSRYKYISEIPYYDDLLFEPSVIITYVQPSSEAGALSSFTEGDLVVYVEGQKVHSVEDIKKLSQGKSQISVESDRGAFALLAP